VNCFIYTTYKNEETLELQYSSRMGGFDEFYRIYQETCVTVAIAILGANFDKETTFGYEAFYSPIIIGIIAVLPSYVLYSRKELSFKQMLFRRILHFIVLELILIGFGYLTKILNDINVTVSFALSVFIIYLITNLITWIIDSRTASEINVGLKRLQE
jgi:hypothetical protein